MAVNQSTFDYALKTLYPDGITRDVYVDNPFLALVKKNTRFFGRNRVIDVLYGDTQGRSAAFATAQANVGNHKGVAFTITRKQDYAYATIARETMKATANDAGAVVEALETEMQSAINVLKNSLAHASWGDGSGMLGQVASISGNTVTLADVNQCVNFEVNKVCEAWTALSAGTQHGAAQTVTAVNRNAGTVTFNGVASWAANDYLVTNGDYGAKVSGVQAWIPATDPVGGDNFFGVDRSVDTLRLAGLRYDGSSLSPEEAILQGAYRLGREEGRPDYAFLSFLDLANLETSLGSKKTYEDVEGPAGIGFTAVVINGPRGKIRCMPDRNAPRGLCYLMSMDSWTLHSLGDAPQIVDEDGTRIFRQSNADGFEVRLAYYAQLACNAPGHNARIVLPT